MTQPIPCIWKDKAFRPVDAKSFRFADATFAEGERVLFDPERSRSKPSHDQFFAVVHDLWATLPEDLAERFPTPDSLRHYALCKARFCDVSTFVASSKAEAGRLADFVKSGAQPGAQVVVQGSSVIRLTPHSQSLRAMGRDTFQRSKDAVFAVIAELLDVDPADVGKAVAA